MVDFHLPMQSIPITIKVGGHHGRDRMVVAFTTTCAITVYHH